MITHHVIDALRGIHGKLSPVDGVTPAIRRAFADVLEGAQVFDFGRLPLEPGGKEGEWEIPNPTKEERDWWAQQLIPLPFAG